MSTDQPQSLTPGKRQTLKARQAQAARFTTPEAKREHYRALARRANNGRLILSTGQATSLAVAYTTAEPELRAVEELAAVWSPLASILAEIAERVARSSHHPLCTEPTDGLGRRERTGEERP